MAVSSKADQRRANNAKGLSAFGAPIEAGVKGNLFRVIREGDRITVFTVGYERRDGESLIAALRDAGVEHLADIRENPVSRKPDFRARALKALCEDAGIEYGAWPDLGSTESQRDALHETGDFSAFRKNFRAHAQRRMSEPIERLCVVARKKTVALLCYERSHEECHRSIIAELMADRLDAGITALL
ncbi:MAG: DUF488 domain-containing protein [Phycisphaeraceae bacterium]|nr:DUF488 domain-containing protein [Phycisphaeraceae bacterium]